VLGETLHSGLRGTVGLPIQQPGAEPPDDDIHALIASFRPDAVRVARRLVRSEAEAEDLAQTAVMNVLARAHAISDRELVKAYLMTAVRNLWRNQLRSGRRIEPARDQEIFERIAQPSPDDPPVSVVDADMLRVAMETLSPANAALIQLRYGDRLDYATIGDRLGISAPTARQRVHRAREQLRSACFAEEPETTSTRVCYLTKVRLGRYARGVLPGRVAARVSLHLMRCDDCRSVYSDLTHVLGVEPNPDAFPQTSPEA
jgi:RNA polymerase sigma factor (sigma-70 family)